jgi:hypothetical protein
MAQADAKDGDAMSVGPIPFLNASTQRLGQHIARVIEDIHAGLIAGFDKLWYG